MDKELLQTLLEDDMQGVVLKSHYTVLHHSYARPLDELRSNHIFSYNIFHATQFCAHSTPLIIISDFRTSKSVVKIKRHTNNHKKSLPSC